MPRNTLTRNQLLIVVCLVLAVVTLLVYWPITLNGFTIFDDDGYITGNTHVNTGLSWPNAVWAFENGQSANWHPLTWLSHMIDCDLYDLNPGGHHLTNLFFHIANTLLLFLLLIQMTGALWRSALVAALFAWHPLHVESVAWAAERKDVLSAFFWMLTLLAYVRYTQTRAEASATRQPLWFYSAALFFFACGLMSKPMVVTLPCVLLLLDFWPLSRFTAKSVRSLILEKLPFFGLAAAGSIVTYFAQKAGGAVSADTFPFRIENALWAYLRYISKLIWPTDMAVIYPFPSHGLTVLAIISAALLLIWSGIVIVRTRQNPYLFTGWFLFLGTLVPVIGLVQVGSQSMADRYTYIPSIGLFILMVWGLNDWLNRWPQKRTVALMAGTAVLAGCLATTGSQIKYWHDSIGLFQHAIKVTEKNYVAYACLGKAFEAEGQEEEALVACTNAVRINPNYPPGQFFLGLVLLKKRQTDEGLAHLNIAAKLSPRDRAIQYTLGKFLRENGQPGDAIAHFAAALNADPQFAEAHNGLGKAYFDLGKPSEAVDELSKAVALEPGNPRFHYDLGTILLSYSKVDAAITRFSEALRLQPDYVEAHVNLAAAFIKLGQTQNAIVHFSSVVQLQPDNSGARFNLGLAFLDNHQPAEAEAQFIAELRLTPNETRAHFRLAQALERQIKFAEAATHYRAALRFTPDFPQAQTALDQILAAHPELKASEPLDTVK